MYSKFLLPILTLTAVSCSYFFDEKEKKSNTYNLSLSEKTSVSCIEQNNQLLKDYFNMKRSDQEMAVELQKMNTCVNDAINLFVKHTKGADADYYTAGEIHEFISQVFDSYSYGPKFLEDVVLLKDSLMGGTQYRISKDEVRMLPLYVNFVYQSLAELAPERHLLFSDRTGDNWEAFNKAGDKFVKVIARFKSLPNKKNGMFDYPGMVRIATVLIDDETSHWHKTFDLVNSLQSLLLKGQRDLVKIEELPTVIDDLSRLYLSYMEFNKFLNETGHCDDNDEACKSKGFFRDFASVFIFPALVTRLVDYPDAFRGKTEILVSTQMKVLGTLRTALKRTGGVELSYINDMVDTLSRIEALPETIKAATLVEMAPQFFGFWLSKNSTCVQQRCQGTLINAEQIDTLVDLVQSWKERQEWINQAMAARKSITRTQHKAAMKKSGVLSANLLDFQDALENVQHAHWEKYVHVGSKELNYKDLVIFNKLFTLIKLFLRPFNNNATQADVLNYYLKQSQVQYFYEWFRPLALELKLIDPRSRNSGKQAFIEINLFGSSSSKPEQMDFAELIEYFEIALSTSSRTDYLMLNKFTACIIPYDFDVFNYERRKSDCFRDEFVNSANEYFFSTLPQFGKYFKNVSGADYPKYLKVLEKAGRQGVIANTEFDTDAVRVMSSIAQYAESLFLRFEDPNDDDERIQSKELQRALAHIVPNLNRLLYDSLPEDEVKDIFKKFPTFETDLVTYMLRYNQIPSLLNAVTTAEKLKGAVALKTWSIGQATWVEEEASVSREDVMLVVSGLSAFARTSKIKALRKIFVDNELELKKGNYTDVNHKMFHELARELTCSTLRDQEVREWLMKNQDSYWKNALQYFDINILGYQVQLDATDVPQTGLFAGWEGMVVSKLITEVVKSPIGGFCQVPYLNDIHQVVEE